MNRASVTEITSAVTVLCFGRSESFVVIRDAAFFVRFLDRYLHLPFAVFEILVVVPLTRAVSYSTIYGSCKNTVLSLSKNFKKKLRVVRQMFQRGR